MDGLAGSELRPAPDRSVGVLTVAPFHNSLGDISTAEVTQRWLAFSGVPADQASFWDHDRRGTLVIGGGDLIAAPRKGAWRDIKPLLLPRGAHILNAVGIDPGSFEDLATDALHSYPYVSVRDYESQALLDSRGIDALPVPCPAALQPSIPLEILKHLPRYGFLAPLHPGQYVVIHRHQSLVPTARKLHREGRSLVVVDMQAHARHGWPRNLGIEVPATHSSLIIKGLVDSSAFVETSSLHLAIFALGSKVPFAVIDAGNYQSNKVRRYLDRAGIIEAMSAPAAVGETLQQVAGRVAQVSAREAELAREHLLHVTSAISNG
jgi:hypothetical protein